MRVLLAVLLLFALSVSGCARKKAARTPELPAPRAGAPVAALEGRVAKVEPAARFVVLSFPPNQMPVLDLRLNIYRHGVKVAEVKVTGPQRDNHVAADIVTGTPEEGDEARAD